MLPFVAHWPFVGVKVQVVVAKLFNAGDHVPVIELFEVVGNAETVAPEQIGFIGVNNGVTIGFTVIVNVAFATHCPEVGTNVQVVVAKLLSAGDHVPVIELLEVVGNGDNVAPKHIGFTALNVGVILGVTVITTVFDKLQTTLVVKEISSSAKSFPADATTLSNRAI